MKRLWIMVAAVAVRCWAELLPGQGIEDERALKLLIPCDRDGAGASYAADLSSYGTKGTAEQNAFWTADYWQYDGDNDCVSWVNAKVSQNLGLQRTVPFTITAWVKLDDTSTGATILSKMLGSSSYRGWLFYVPNGSVSLMLRYDNPTGNRIWVQTSETLETGKWYYLVATYDGSVTAAGAQIYINGEAATMVTNTDALSNTIVTTATAAIGVIRSTNSNDLDGKVGELRVYKDRMLTQDEIRQRYHQGLRIIEQKGM
jgi:hypothetical protein